MKIILALLSSLGLFCTITPAHAEGLKDTAGAYNGLGFQLLAQCRQSLPKTNYFLSPAGLAFALSMAQNGAQGETLRQIMATLQVGNIPPAQLNKANKALLDHLSKLDPKIKLEIANALWVDQKISIRPDFISINRRDYGVNVANGNFQDPATVKKINTGQREHARKNPNHHRTAPEPVAPVNRARRNLFQRRLVGTLRYQPHARSAVHAG